MKLWDKIQAFRKSRQARNWAQTVVTNQHNQTDKAAAELRAHIAKQDARIVALKTERDILRDRCRVQAGAINARLKEIGVPNADTIANPRTGRVNEEQCRAILRDVDAFVNQSVYAAAAEIAAAHGIRPSTLPLN